MLELWKKFSEGSYYLEKGGKGGQVEDNEGNDFKDHDKNKIRIVPYFDG